MGAPNHNCMPAQIVTPLKNYQIGELRINTFSGNVYRNQQRIRLNRKEFELLAFMAKNKDKVVSRLTILEQIWHCCSSVKSGTLDVHMASLRRKIDNNYPFKLIQTIYRTGYRLSDAI